MAMLDQFYVSWREAPEPGRRWFGQNIRAIISTIAHAMTDPQYDGETFADSIQRLFQVTRDTPVDLPNRDEWQSMITVLVVSMSYQLTQVFVNSLVDPDQAGEDCGEADCPVHGTAQNGDVAPDDVRMGMFM